MTDRDALIRRIAGAIARKTASAAPAAVLEEIETTHELIERGRWERVLAAANAANLWWKEGALSDMACLQPGDLDPIRHDAAKADTSARPGATQCDDSVPQNVADCHSSETS